MMRAILGGTFDPIHWGHLHPAQAVVEHIGADMLHLMPSAQPPHRPYPGASAEQRLNMVQLAATELPACQAESWELHQDRKSYTALTLAQLAKKWHHDSLVFVLGEDAFAGLPQWYQWQHLLDHAHLVVMRRPHSQPHFCDTLQTWLNEVLTTSVEALHQQPRGLVYMAETPAYNISATAIRNAIQTDQPWQQWVPAPVAEFITRHQLYR